MEYGRLNWIESLRKVMKEVLWWRCWHTEQNMVHDGHEFGTYQLIHEQMNVNLYKFCSLMINRICRHVHDTDVVTLNDCCFGCCGTYFTQKITNLDCFYKWIGYASVFSPCTRTRDNTLAFGGPGDEVITEEHTIPRCGETCGGGSP